MEPDASDVRNRHLLGAGGTTREVGAHGNAPDIRHRIRAVRILHGYGGALRRLPYGAPGRGAGRGKAESGRTLRHFAQKGVWEDSGNN